MGWLLTLASLGLKIWSWITGRQQQHAGAMKQRVADDTATQKAETDAARATDRVGSDPGYAQRVRDRYTDRGDG